MEWKNRVVLICLGLIVECIQGASIEEVNNNNNLARSLDASRVLSSLANNFMARAGFITTGTTASGNASQMVTFNIQNLLYLVLLKVLIFAAASIGADHDHNHEHHYKDGFARSGENVPEKFFSDEEMLMYLSFLSGSPTCLQNIACLQPQQAKKYVTAGELVLKAAKMFSYNPDMNYEYTLKEMEHASNIGLAGGSCNDFHCSYTNH